MFMVHFSAALRFFAHGRAAIQLLAPRDRGCSQPLIGEPLVVGEHERARWRSGNRAIASPSACCWLACSSCVSGSMLEDVIGLLSLARHSHSSSWEPIEQIYGSDRCINCGDSVQPGR